MYQISKHYIKIHDICSNSYLKKTEFDILMNYQVSVNKIKYDHYVY
jgi:hypothetical protein